MAFGIITRDPSNKVIIDTSSRKGLSYIGRNLSQTTSFNDGVPTGFSSAFSAPSLVTLPSIGGWATGSGTTPTLNFYAQGYCSSTAAAYTVPSHVNISSASDGATVPVTAYSVATDIYKFGAAQKTTATDWGIRTSEAADLSLLDSNYKTLHLQYNASGTYLFTATATAVPLPSLVNSVSTFVAPTVSQNITFPQPLDDPPLIFITDTGGGYVSLYCMNTDANGKYAGATVIAMNSMGNTYYNPGTAYLPSVGSSTSFTYFIVSAQPSIVPSTLGTWGIKVKDNLGTVTFDSRYITPSIFASGTFPTNYMVMSGSMASLSITPTTNAASVSSMQATGLLLNNFTAITSYHLRTSYLVQGSFSIIDVAMYGDYVNIAGSSFAVGVGGTTGQIRSYTSWLIGQSGSLLPTAVTRPLIWAALP